MVTPRKSGSGKLPEHLILLMNFFSSKGSKLDQKFKPWVSPVTVKVRVLQNALNGICASMRTNCGQIFSSIRRCLLEILPLKTLKCVKIGAETKRRSDFFWLKSETPNTQKLKLEIQKV